MLGSGTPASLAFPGLEPHLNSTCLFFEGIPKGSSVEGELTVLPHLTNQTLPQHFIIVDVQEASSTMDGFTTSWTSPEATSRYVESRLSLLQRNWYYFEPKESFPLLSIETCDPPVSPETRVNETTFEDSQFVPRLTLLPPMPDRPIVNGTTPAWTPSMKTQDNCVWGGPTFRKADVATFWGLSIPVCPTSYVVVNNGSETAPFRTFFYVSASPAKWTQEALDVIVQQLNTSTSTNATVGFYLALRWNALRVTSKSLAPLRIHNDLLLSFEGPEGIHWPVAPGTVSVYGAMRPTDSFMNSTRDRAYLFYMVRSGCFLRTHAPLFNNTAAIVTTDEANRRVNVQLSLFYAINNQPDTKTTPPYYGYVGVLLKDARFIFVHFSGATLPSESFPGQIPINQLSQVIIASLGGIVLVMALLIGGLAYKLKKANKTQAEYQAVATLE